MKDDKYIVFKRDDDSLSTYGAESAIEDAVVIRKHDVFASPALWSYAHSIAITAGILRAAGDDEHAKQLQDIADYFAEQAQDADAMYDRKLPD